MFLILFYIVNANIWDNMFGNHLAPIVVLPSNFHVQFGTQRHDSPYVVDLNYSASLKGARMIVSSSMFNQHYELSDVIMNLTNSELYIHNLARNCQAFKAPPLNATIEPIVAFELFSLYRGTGDDDLVRFEISALFGQKNKAYALFSREDLTLQEIQVELNTGQNFTFYVTKPLVEQTFNAIDFFIPNEWHCTAQRIPVTQISDLIGKLFT